MGNTGVMGNVPLHPMLYVLWCSMLCPITSTVVILLVLLSNCIPRSAGLPVVWVCYPSASVGSLLDLMLMLLMVLMLSTMLLVLHTMYYAGSLLNALYYWCTALLVV